MQSRPISNFMTIIWAPQSRTSAVGADRIGCESHRREPLRIRLGCLGERRELPQRGPGQSADSDFFRIDRKSELIYGHRCVTIQLQRWANRDKSGTPSQNGTNGRPGRTVIIFPETRR